MDQPENTLERARKIAPERLLLLALFLLTAGLWIWAVYMLPRPLEVTAFAVGKGDAFLIRSASGKTVLIDGGSSSVPDVGPHLLVPNLMLAGVKRLDAVLITHPDSDHINGLPAVLDALPVGVILDSGIPNDSTPYQQIVSLAEEKKIPLQQVRAGDRINLDAQASLQILAPGGIPLSGTPADSNNNSVVCMLGYRQARMLFTGDLESDGERALLNSGADLRAEVLKVTHHGSRNGSSAEFLDRVNPTWTLISCPGGGDHSEHPSRQVLDRLRERQIRILRTDVSGMIRMTTTGQGWTVRTYRDK